MRLTKKAMGGLGAYFLMSAMTAVSLPAHADVVGKLKFDEIVAQSSACVVAEVTNIEYGRDEAGIYTLTTFSVVKVAFGDIGDTITVRTAGGRYKQGKISGVSVASGTPIFFNGRKSMLFLSESTSGGAMEIVGENQGLFALVPSNDNFISMPSSMGGVTSVDVIIDRARSRRAVGNTDDLAQ
ncbi:MAG: hypothetical protein AAGH42_05375 [Pseudomonadota bacterium]